MLPSATGLLEPLASGERRAAYLPAMPPNDLVDGWCVDPRHGSTRPAAPEAKDDGKGGVLVSGTLAFVPDAPGADLLVGVALLDTGKPSRACAIEASREAGVCRSRRCTATTRPARLAM